MEDKQSAMNIISSYVASIDDYDGIDSYLKDGIVLPPRWQHRRHMEAQAFHQLLSELIEKRMADEPRIEERRVGRLHAGTRCPVSRWRCFSGVAGGDAKPRTHQAVNHWISALEFDMTGVKAKA